MCTIHNSNLVPLIAPDGRLFLTTRSHHKHYLSELLKDRFVRHYTKFVKLVGFDHLSGRHTLEKVPNTKELLDEWPADI